MTSNEQTTQINAQSQECHLPDSIDYVKKAGPPLLLSSPYHMITQPKMFVTRADSSGHGSDCSSFKEVKVNFRSQIHKTQKHKHVNSEFFERELDEKF